MVEHVIPFIGDILASALLGIIALFTRAVASLGGNHAESYLMISEAVLVICGMFILVRAAQIIIRKVSST
jgi:hypothetical protein